MDVRSYGKTIDFGRAAGDYARHRAGFPEAFFERLAAIGVARAGTHALDLGTGTGTVARGLAHLGLSVTALDRSAAMMEEARRLDAAEGVRVEYVVGTAEDTGLAESSFDLVTAGQCWHWFERSRAAAEARRLLVAGGRLLIAHFDWIPLPGNVAEATEKLIQTHNPEWRLAGGLGIYGPWLRDMGIAGFREIESFSFDLDVSYSHEAWRGRIRASAGVGASMPPRGVERFDAELKALLEKQFPDDPMPVLHRVFAVFGTAP